VIEVRMAGRDDEAGVRQASGEKLADYALFTWGPAGTGTADNPYWRWAGPPLSLAQVNRPSETFNLMDGYTTTQMTVGIVRRHHEGMNAGFLDGHARWVSSEQRSRYAARGGASTTIVSLPPTAARSNGQESRRRSTMFIPASSRG
jgi:prepilin-type processing-associated H-X9-DG protein